MANLHIQSIVNRFGRRTAPAPAAPEGAANSNINAEEWKTLISSTSSSSSSSSSKSNDDELENDPECQRKSEREKLQILLPCFSCRIHYPQLLAQSILVKIGGACFGSTGAVMSLQSFIIYFIASLVMHSPGIYGLFTFGRTPPWSLAMALASAGLEGVLTLSITMKLFQTGRRLCTSATTVADAAASQNHYQSQNQCEQGQQRPVRKPSLVQKVLSSIMRYIYKFHLDRILSIALGLVITAFSISVVASDYVFQKKVGGIPNMWIIISGFKDSKSLLRSEASANMDDFKRMIVMIVSTTTLTFTICILQNKWEARSPPRPAAMATSTPTTRNFDNCHCLRFWRLSHPNIFLACTCLYIMGAWIPIFHASASLCGSTFMVPPGTRESKYPTSIIKHPVNEGKEWPNVVVVMHESLSGEYMLTRQSSMEYMPFFRSMLHSEDDFHVFEHARTVSGDTVDALTAIQSGCLPLDHEKGGGRTQALSTSMATEFKRRGFDTVSFSSRDLVSRIDRIKYAQVLRAFTICCLFRYSSVPQLYHLSHVTNIALSSYSHSSHRQWKALNGS